MKTILSILMVATSVLAADSDNYTTNAPKSRAVTATPTSGFAFGSLSLVDSNSLAMVAGQFTQITNCAVATVNAFTGSATAGTLTNRSAGYYRIIFDACWASGGTDQYKGSVFTNGVECTLVSFERTALTSTNTASAAAVVYLPASCRIDARLSNLSSTNAANLRKAHLAVGTP